MRLRRDPKSPKQSTEELLAEMELLEAEKRRAKIEAALGQDARTDVVEAAVALPSIFGVKRALGAVPGLLDASETVKMLATGSYARGTGLVVLTDRRVLILRDDFTKAKVEVFALTDDLHMEWSTGMGGGLAFSNPQAKAVVRSVDKAVGRAFADEVLASLTPRSSESPAAALLRELASLHDSGVLTDREYEAKKAELLGRL